MRAGVLRAVAVDAQHEIHAQLVHHQRALAVGDVHVVGLTGHIHLAAQRLQRVAQLK